MKRKMEGTLVISFSFLPVVLSLLFYSSLPEIIPTNWNIYGIADSFAPRSHIFLMAGGLTLLMLTLYFLMNFAAKHPVYQSFIKAFRTIQISLFIFFQLLFGFMLYSTIHSSSFMANFFCVCFGSLMLVLGNYMPKIRHNYFVGVRTPWTLASPECWYKTHRFSGGLWVLCGLALLLFSLLKNNNVTVFFLFFGTLIFLVVIPLVYSFIVYKKETASCL